MNLLPIALLLAASAPEPSLPVVGAAKRVLAAHRLSALQRFYAGLSKAYPGTEPTPSSTRDVVAGFRESVSGLRIQVRDKGNPNSFTEYRYRVALITEGDNLIYYELAAEHSQLTSHGWHASYSPVAHYQNAAAFTRLARAYRSVIGAALHLPTLFDRSITYGNRCGIAGVPPPEQRVIQQLVARRDTAALMSWLRSATAEKQVYGLQGLGQLWRQGMRPAPGQLRLARFVQQKQGSINTCSGCTYFAQDLRAVIQALTYPQPGG